MECLWGFEIMAKSGVGWKMNFEKNFDENVGSRLLPLAVFYLNCLRSHAIEFDVGLYTSLCHREGPYAQE